MVSERKREANRRNAQKPRGPRKKTKAFHPYEDFPTFYWDLDLLAELQQDYRETLQPQNKLEESLVELLCHATLRLKRVPYIEHEYHATHRYGFLFNEKENHFGPFYRADSKLFYQQLARYEAGAQRSFYKALDTLLKLQDDRRFRRGGHEVRPPQQPEPSHLPIPSVLHRERADTRSAPTKEIVVLNPDLTKKTPPISHQTSLIKKPEPQAPQDNPPKTNRWLTAWLATVSHVLTWIQANLTPRPSTPLELLDFEENTLEILYPSTPRHTNGTSRKGAHKASGPDPPDTS